MEGAAEFAGGALSDITFEQSLRSVPYGGEA